jgi:hypothetical protein
MITTNKLRDLSVNPTSSWALWNENGDSDFEFFNKKLHLLKPDVVFLGLNRSNVIKSLEIKPFINFHAPNHTGDNRLKRFIQEGLLENLIGAYMTDLSIEIETDSTKVKIDKSAIHKIVNEINYIKPNRRTIICIGDKSFKSLCKCFQIQYSKIMKNHEKSNLKFSKAIVNDEEWYIYRVWMHSNYGSNQNKGEIELKKQLELINEFISTQNYIIE